MARLSGRSGHGRPKRHPREHFAQRWHSPALSRVLRPSVHHIVYQLSASGHHIRQRKRVWRPQLHVSACADPVHRELHLSGRFACGVHCLHDSEAALLDSARPKLQHLP